MAVTQHNMALEEKKPTYLHVSNNLQLAQAQSVHEFYQSNIFKDKIIRLNPIIKAILYRRTDTFITLEEKKRCVKFISAMSNEAIPGIAKSHAVTKVTQSVKLPIPNATSYIISMAFNESDGILALCSTEGLIYFYEGYQRGGRKDFKLFKIVCTCEQSC